MLGWVEYRTADAPAAPVRLIGGARFRVARVERGEGAPARLSAYLAARSLSRDGVHCAVFPPDYPHCKAFARRGVLPPPLTPLYHATAAAIVRRYMAQIGFDTRHGTLVFAARSVSPELRQAAFELSASARHIALTPMSGAEALAGALRRERGVAARILAPDETSDVGAAVCFEPCGTFAPELPLYAPKLTVEYGAALSTDVLAALWTAGALDASALAVRAVGARDDCENRQK